MLVYNKDRQVTEVIHGHNQLSEDVEAEGVQFSSQSAGNALIRVAVRLFGVLLKAKFKKYSVGNLHDAKLNAL